MNTTKEIPFFRKEVDHFVLYKPAPLRPKKAEVPSGATIMGRYKTWQEAQLESLKHFGRKAAKIR
ncbi:MAG TPA: hypothetical protein VD967_02340 [Candidatus Paceibacterota bacterium]|nr:hypothetical protein [Candidatus Paceibacterota bacterium]